MASPLPSGETYLKFAGLDPADIDGIAAFLTQYGELGLRGQFSTASSTEWATLGGPKGGEGLAELRRALDGAVEVLGPMAETYDLLVEVQWAILLMRDFVAAWRALQGEINPAEHVWESPLWQARRDRLDSPPWTPEGPAVLLHLWLGEGLMPFSPTLRTFRPGEEPVALYADQVTAWNLCCLELFNHIVERAEYKTCANETCGRLFVRQEGRAVHGQYRSRGVKYCSAECARAQAQRVYRRRKATTANQA